MSLDLKQLKQEIDEGRLRRKKVVAIQRVILVNAAEIKEVGLSASDLIIKLEIPPSYLSEVNKMLGLYDDLKDNGYTITNNGE